MDPTPILDWIQRTGLAVYIRDSLLAFPVIESTHVVALTLVFGTIVIMDLRLLGLASTGRPFARLESDIVKWTWISFALAAVTGALMFITNADVYFHNTYFRLKMLLLVLAAINVLVFEMTVGRTVEQWGDTPTPPPLGRAIATVSLVIWIGVIVAGRMIGFTTTRGTLNEPAPTDTNLEQLLGLPADGGNASDQGR